MASDESGLVARLKQRDAESFEVFVKENIGWMSALAHRISNCPDDTAECVQEAFSIAYQKIDGFEERSSLKTWLHRIVVNQALMKLRKRRSRREQSIDDLMPDFDKYGFLVGPVRISDASAEELLSKDEVARKVHQEILGLPDNYRVVLILRDIEEMTSAETATALGIDEGAVRTRLHRARQALKRKLEPIFDPTYLDDVL